MFVFKLGFRIGLALFLLLTVIFVLLYIQFGQNVKYTPSPTSALIDESMTVVNAKRFDKTGRLTQVVTMGSWLHYKGETVTHMVAPTLKIYQTDGSRWHIHAKKGEGFQAKMNGKLDKIHLIDNVVVSRIGLTPNAWLELNTQTLLFFPQQPIALTDAPVVIYGPGVEIHAKGLRADLDKQHVELLTEVNTNYAKQS